MGRLHLFAWRYRPMPLLCDVQYWHCSSSYAFAVRCPYWLCYAMPGTDVDSPATHPLCDVRYCHRPKVAPLRTRYTMSSTDIGHFASRIHPRERDARVGLRVLDGTV
eukprot:1155900-Rhodomonas_salina.2